MVPVMICAVPTIEKSTTTPIAINVFIGHSPEDTNVCNCLDTPNRGTCQVFRKGRKRGALLVVPSFEEGRRAEERGERGGLTTSAAPFKGTGAFSPTSDCAQLPDETLSAFPR